MLTSESIAKIADAMASVQAEMTPAIKDSANPFFKSKYADLTSVSEACRGLMTKNGIAVIQSPGECAEKQVMLTTRLIHKSGEWLEGTLAIPLPKYDAQAYGSAITYARRYALAAMAGVVTDDDDGNAASRPTNNAVSNDAPAKQTPVKLDGPFKTKTALQTAIRGMVHEINGCGDSNELEAYLVGDEPNAIMEQTRRDFPQWMDGGPNVPEDYEPITNLIARLRKEFEALDNNNLRAG